MSSRVLLSLSRQRGGVAVFIWLFLGGWPGLVYGMSSGVCMQVSHDKHCVRVYKGGNGNISSFSETRDNGARAHHGPVHPIQSSCSFLPGSLAIRASIMRGLSETTTVF